MGRPPSKIMSAEEKKADLKAAIKGTRETETLKKAAEREHETFVKKHGKAFDAAVKAHDKKINALNREARRYAKIAEALSPGTMETKSAKASA